MYGTWLSRCFCGGVLVALVSAGSAIADQSRGNSRDGANWRTPPPAWGYPPGATPYSTFPRSPSDGGYRRQTDRNERYRPDRQRWRDDPYDRHELNRYDDRRGGYDDRRGGYDDRRGRGDRHDRQGSIVRPYQPDNQRLPPTSGPFAPRPREDHRGYYGNDRRGGFDDR